jgi:putative effector of murein hydrolase LrgA (UPF0299 family)
MLASLTWLLVCQLIGEAGAKLLGLPVPGPVLGMVLLLAILLARGGASEKLQATAAGLLEHLSLLFVPAGVGVMMHFSLVRAEWPAIAVALVGSTIITLVVTAWLMAWLGRKP